MGDDLGRSVGIEEAVANGLANGLIGAAVVPTRPGRAVDQRGGALLGKGVAKLEIALLAVAEGLGGLHRAEAKAFTGEEHGKFAGDFVVAGEGQGTRRAEELALLAVELEHVSTPDKEKRKYTPERIVTGGSVSNE